MKLFVFNDVFSRYSSGVAVILADSYNRAIELAVDKFDEYNSTPDEILEEFMSSSFKEIELFEVQEGVVFL